MTKNLPCLEKRNCAVEVHVSQRMSSNAFDHPLNHTVIPLVTCKPKIKIKISEATPEGINLFSLVLLPGHNANLIID